MAATALMLLAAGISLLFGSLHLLFTFWGSRLSPRDPAWGLQMQAVSPRISNETTMWKCWIGFNASHSMALMLFGLIYGFLALTESVLLFHSPFLLVLGLVTLGSFVVLAKAYWFSVPFTGVSVATACYVGSVAVSMA